MQATGKIYMTLFMLCLFIGMVLSATAYPPKASFLPFVIGIPAIILTTLQLFIEFRAWRQNKEMGVKRTRTEIEKVQDKLEKQLHRKVDLDIVHEELHVIVEDKMDIEGTSKLQREAVLFGAFFGLVGGILLFGFWLTIPIFLILFLRLSEKESWKFILLLTGTAWLILFSVFDQLLGIILHQGFLTEYLMDLFI